MKKWLLIFCFLLTSCVFKKPVLKEIEIEIGSPFPETINGQQIIDYDLYDNTTLGNQNVTVTYQNNETEKILVKTIDSTPPELITLKPFVALLNSKVDIYEYFQFTDNSNTKVKVSHSKIDTSKTGIKDIELTLTDSSKNKKIVNVSLAIIDPADIYIRQRKRLEIKKGNPLNLSDFFETNPLGETLEIIGYYDLNIVGVYPVEITSNQKKLNVLLYVYDFKEETDIYEYTLIETATLRNDSLILVNKRYQLPSDYVPKNLVEVPSQYQIHDHKLTADTYEAFLQMRSAGLKEGADLIITSGYRSFFTQAVIYQNFKNIDPFGADTYSARPGHSEHHLGTVIDFCEGWQKCLESFTGTHSEKWVNENAYKYGFILSFPLDKVEITGYTAEPWHYRYVGVDIATKMKKLNLTFEEYYFQFIINE